MSNTTDIEKESLEAHVELCAIRYGALEQKFHSLEQRMEKLDTHMVDIKNTVSNNITNSNKQAFDVFLKVIGILAAGILGFITHYLFK